jgi:D-alanyl-D-alanine carboxypeptidase (penicillin-binding protein 5/6)
VRKISTSLKLLLALTLALGTISLAPTTAFASVKDSDIVGDVTAAQYKLQGLALPDVGAPYAALGTKDGRLLWGRAVDTKVPMASVTKIMTAVVALEQADLGTVMTVTEGAATTGGSTANLKKGDQLTLEQLLYCMMLPSGNDAAVCIAQNISSLEITYTKLMNAKAYELGMSFTNFLDASGLTEEADKQKQYSTASDLLILTRYAMRNTTFRTIVATHDYEFKCGTRTIKLKSTDYLADFLTDGLAIGIKTGSNTKAKYCFVGAAVKGDVELYAVILASKTDVQRFIDCNALLQWGFAHQRSVELLTPLTKAGSVGLTSWIDKNVDVYVSAPVYATCFDLDGAVAQEVELGDYDGSVAAGDTLGRVVWMQGAEVIATCDLVAASSVPEPDILGAIAIALQRFIGWFGGTSAHIPTAVYLQETIDPAFL